MQKPIQRVTFTKAIARDQNPSSGYICPGEPHQRSPTLQNLRIGLKRRQSGKSKVPASGSWPPSENRCLPASTLKPEEREFVVDSGASMHMISKKDLSDAEMDTMTKSCSPTKVPKWRSANAWRCHSVRQKIGYILECENPREYASSLIAWKALRWKRIFLWMEQRSKTTSHQQRDSDTMQHGELRSFCGSMLVNEFFFRFSSFNFNDTFETGEALFHIILKFVYFTNDNNIKWQWDSRKRGSNWNWIASSACVKFQCWWENGETRCLSWIQSRTIHQANQQFPKQIERRPDRTEKRVVVADSGAQLLKSRRGCKNSERKSRGWEFLNTETQHASSSHEVSLEPILKRREDLGKHSVYTHFPKDRNCEICKRTKITRAPCRRRNGGAVPRAEKFGDLITADHKVLSECESRNNHGYAVVVQDLATQWIQAYPCKTKTSQETQRSLQKFLEPERNPEVIYTDKSLGFGTACEDLSWNHCTSTPHRSETNGIAERAVRRVKEGTSAVLLQSGLNESWWADSMECYTYLRNVTDLLSDGKTPYERRFGQPFTGPIIPFGSLVEYHPFTAKDQSRIHQFGKKVLPGLFLGYALYAGEIWKGDVLIADLEEFESMDASEIHSKRLNAKELIFPKQGEFIFPIADGRIKPLRGEQDLRTSTLVRHRPIQGENNIDFLGESEGSLPQPQDSLPDAGEAINDFWSMSGSFIYRRHVEPRVKLYSPREESFPVPLKYFDVSRTTHTNLDVKQEKRIDDYWNIDGSRDLSDYWTGFTQFTLLEEKPPNGYIWSGERLTTKQLTSRPDHLWPELWKSMGKHVKLKEK